MDASKDAAETHGVPKGLTTKAHAVFRDRWTSLISADDQFDTSCEVPVEFWRMSNDSTDRHAFVEALTDLMQEIAATPQLYNNRGVALGAVNRWVEAIQDYDRAIGNKPDYAEAYFNRANAYLRLGSYQNAIHDYSKALQLRPDDPQAFNNRGNTYSGLVPTCINNS